MDDQNVTMKTPINFVNICELDSISDAKFLEEIDEHIQCNLDDDRVQEVLKSGVDLRQYSKQVEAELHSVENAAIQDYIDESCNIASLHSQISSCDAILERMQEMLHGFQSDLGNISSEIQILQQQSLSMNVKLRNRQAVRGELSQFVDEMAVPEDTINIILDSPVTDVEFTNKLQELNHKISFVKEQSFKESRSSQDVCEILEKLKIKAISKIRDFLLQKIYSFRKPNTNYQVPQNILLKHRYFNEFLMANQWQIAKEVQDNYVETAGKINYSYFKSYMAKVVKLQYEERIDREDLMGVEENAKHGLFSRPSLKNRSTIFTLGTRGNILKDIEAPIIVPHVAQAAQQKFTFEALFRSMHFSLFDNCCREYLFVTSFFLLSGPPAKDLFMAVMGRTLGLFERQMDDYASSCYDSISVFLCIHLCHRYQMAMHKRAVPALDHYWERLQSQLWPRFEYILQLNIHSIKECDPQKLGSISSGPHYITRRYAEFVSAILGINQSFPSEVVARLMLQLQDEVEGFCTKMAGEFPQRRQQLIFLINNYDMMLNVLLERSTEDTKVSQSFKEVLAVRTQEYIEEVLAPHFGGLTAFIKETENAIERGTSADTFKYQEARVNQLVRGFNTDWKKSIEAMNDEIMKSFPNFRNGTQILKGALMQLVQYYHRFQKILSLSPFKSFAVRNESISIHNVMVEVKKHKTTF